MLGRKTCGQVGRGRGSDERVILRGHGKKGICNGGEINNDAGIGLGLRGQEDVGYRAVKPGVQ